MPPKKTAAVGVRKKTPKSLYQRPEPVPKGSVFTDLARQQWKIGPPIGTGGFGDIYSACKASDVPKNADGYQYVVKIEPRDNGPLFVEMHFYLKNAKIEDIETFRKANKLASLGMPHFVGNGSHELNAVKHRFVVMPRYAKDIAKLMLENGNRLPEHTIYRLCIQMLDVFAYIHHCTYVHGDLKGANMLLGFGKAGAGQVYLVDFGLADRYTTAAEFKPNPKNMHNGTIEYTSRDAHCGVPTMRSDLEVLAYNLVNWFGLALPWEADKLLGSPAKVHEAKKTFMADVEKSLRTVFGSPPAPVLQFFKYINTLDFNETPNYTKCRQIFEAGLKALGKSNTGDLVFIQAVETTTPKKAAKRTATRPEKKIPSPSAAKRSRTKPTDNLVSASEDDSPAKHTRAGKKEVSQTKPPTQKPKGTSEQENSTPSETASEGTLNVNNDIQSRGKKNGKTYEFNFELDVSIDANVVINVKRKKDADKPRDSPLSGKSADKIIAKKKAATHVKREPIDSGDDDEIAASPNSTPVASMRVLNRDKQSRKRAGAASVTTSHKVQRL